MLSTFEDNLDAVSFALLSHLAWSLKILQFYARVEAFSFGFLKELVNAEFINAAHRVGRNFERYPLIFLRDIEALLLQVGQKAAARFTVGVRNRIAGHRTLPG